MYQHRARHRYLGSCTHNKVHGSASSYCVWSGIMCVFEKLQDTGIKLVIVSTP